MSACAIRTSDVRRLQFKPDINTPELEFFARLALESPLFVFVPEYLAEYRSHAASATARGLTIDRLAEYLEPIEVPDDLEVVKRNLLQPMVTAGVGIRLERGDVAGARRLAMSRYYSAGSRALLQRVCLAFPGPMSTHAYAAAAGVGRLLRRGAGPRGA